MKEFMVRFIEAGAGPRGEVPLNIVLVDQKDIENAGITNEEATQAIANKFNGAIGINIFDLEAVTTTSDGLMLQGAIVTMAAADNGKIHKEFGMLDMEEMEFSDEIIGEEPHLKQWAALYEGKKLFRGPNPTKKLIPVHNVVMTGRAVNNNSATEMMNVITMEEILLPIFGQMQLMKDAPVLIGSTGEFISVGIGMTVAEKYGRVFPTRQFKAGDTAHGSKKYAKTLKQHIPCIVAPKDVLARHIIQALKIGMIPGLHIGCSPAVLAVAKAYGAKVDIKNITEKAKAELESVGITIENINETKKSMKEEEIMAKANEIIPGVDNPIVVNAEDIVTKIKIIVE